MYKFITLAFITTCSFSAIAQQKTGAKVFFDLNVPSLNAGAMHTIDSLLKAKKVTKNDDVTLYGYADYLGTLGHNDSISLLRAQNVKKYLIKAGVPAKSITVCVGKGKIDKPARTEHIGYVEDRRVEITIDKKVDLGNVKTNETARLKNINFAPGSHAFLPESASELESLFAYMQKHKKTKIQLEGHICCQVNDQDGYDYDTREYKLSLNRAKAVFDFLVGKGIKAERMTFIGLAHTKPLTDEKTPADEEMNRRVEVRIMAK
ncbi:MAG: OmpA family protein [Bacteroidota bacterium]